MSIYTYNSLGHVFICILCVFFVFSIFLVSFVNIWVCVCVYIIRSWVNPIMKWGSDGKKIEILFFKKKMNNYHDQET
jgi:predicted membrane protein